jgi:hypothetical protein
MVVWMAVKLVADSDALLAKITAGYLAVQLAV